MVKYQSNLLYKIFLFCYLLTFSALSLSVETEKHVRVVLDISKSLSIHKKAKGWPTDPGRLAILSTALLYDLVNPNLNWDSFKVIPFDREWTWEASQSAPLSTRSPIEARTSQSSNQSRKNFIQALEQLKYDGEKTYFYPGLLRATKDLISLKNNEHQVKTIILITDGVPEADIKEQERALIKEELTPLLLKHNIRLYVLAFGKVANKNQNFFKEMVHSKNGKTRLGEFLVDKNGSDLLYKMMRIFSYNFEYIPNSMPLSKGKKLDLDGGFSPARVAVVVYSDRHRNKAPTLNLKPLVNTGGEKMRSTIEKGGSYSLRWVLSPSKTHYQLKTDIGKGHVALIREGKVQLEVLPSPPETTTTTQTVADHPMPLKILVKSLTGGSGDPGSINLSFETYADGNAEALRKPIAPPPESGFFDTKLGGRVYDILVDFPRHPKQPDKDYSGHIKIEAFRGKALVASIPKHSVHVRASGVFHYTGDPVSIDLGTLGIIDTNCTLLSMRDALEHVGEVELELEKLKILPLGHTLMIRVLPAVKIIEAGDGAFTATPADTFEICLKTSDSVGSSDVNEEKWLELRKKGSKEANERIQIKLSWQVNGLSFWQRWGKLILGFIVIVLFIIVIIGFTSPKRFPSSLALVFVPERDELDEHSPIPINQWKGTGTGFFRNARAFLHADYRLSGKSRGALVGLYAEPNGVRVEPKGGMLYRETLDGDWEAMENNVRRLQPGDIFKIGDKGPYFRISVRGK